MDQKVILVGNPNVGKSVIFGYLTGRYVTVSNYPGTTVEITKGKAKYNGSVDEIIDTPGVNSLLPFSEDEVVTRNILLNEKPRLVVQVADAKNLRRALFLSVQLAEMGVPFVLNLNMMDEARSRGVQLDRKKLSEILGVAVVETIAINQRGLSNLTDEICLPAQAGNHNQLSKLAIAYPHEIEDAVAEIGKYLPDSLTAKRALALMILCGDDSLREWLIENVDHESLQKIESLRHNLEAQIIESVNAVINQRRMQKAESIYRAVYKVETSKHRKISDFLSRVSMHRIWGPIILLGVLYAMYEFVGVFGAGTLVGWFEEVLFGEWIIPASEKLFAFLAPIPLLHELLVGEYGLITMALSYAIAIVLPVVATFFLAFGILEDTGYLPRLAVIVNRFFKILGLNGKAVLPMVLGLGCDTMATLTTRILETPKERIIVTLLLALGVPCSAQLGVILGLLGGLSFSSLMIWSGCVLGVLMLVGYLASKILPGETSDFLLELPPIRRPSLGNIVVKTLARVEWYLKEAVPLFFLGTFVLFVMAKTGALASLENWSAPLVSGFLGLPEQTAQAFLIGFLRRDYGAAGLFDLAQQGLLSPKQIVVSLVTITLFVPCIANFFVIIKERGWKTGLAISLFIVPFAFLVGGILNWIL
jgi:ferrous iron transport protein B